MSPENVKVEDLSVEDRGFLEKELPKNESENDDDYLARLQGYKDAKDKGFQRGAQTRIDDIIKKSRTSDEETQRRLTAIEEENRQLKEGKPKEGEVTDADIIVAGGKRWWNDDALEIMVSKGETTEESAKNYRKRRDVAERNESVEKIIDERLTKRELEIMRKQDKINALEKYSFLKDPDDPRYKIADELWKEAYHANPQGLTKAAKRAEEIYKKDELKDLTPEERDKRSKELNVESPTPSKKEKTKEVELTEQEKGWSHQNWKELSPAEAEKKALKAKKRRMGV